MRLRIGPSMPEDQRLRIQAARVRAMRCPMCDRPSCALTRDGFQLCWRCTHPDGDVGLDSLGEPIPGKTPPPKILAYKLGGRKGVVVEVRRPARG